MVLPYMRISLRKNPPQIPKFFMPTLVLSSQMSHSRWSTQKGLVNCSLHLSILAQMHPYLRYFCWLVSLVERVRYRKLPYFLEQMWTAMQVSMSSLNWKLRGYIFLIWYTQSRNCINAMPLSSCFYFLANGGLQLPKCRNSRSMSFPKPLIVLLSGCANTWTRAQTCDPRTSQSLKTVMLMPSHILSRTRKASDMRISTCSYHLEKLA